MHRDQDSNVGVAADGATETYFLPAERSTEAELQRQIASFDQNPMAIELMDASFGFAVVLNRNRQIVHANRAFVDYLSERGLQLTLGQRVGEAVGCIHGTETQGGCGTTEACQYCGAAHSMAAGLRGRPQQLECRIQTGQSGDDLDLLVRTLPLEWYGEQFLVFFAADLSHEKRRKALERIFFHDVTNTAGGIHGIAGLLHDMPTEATTRRFSPLLKNASATLLDEIASQRELTHAEHGDLVRHVSGFASLGFLRDMAELCRSHAVGQGRFVVIEPQAQEILLRTDKSLLARVVCNLVKNALEAEPEGATVRLDVRLEGEEVLIEVRNPSVMPRPVQLQMFQRSFSTKGASRGLGTYSVRLLTERYLGGSVSFESEPPDGTVFRVRIPRVLPADK